MVSKACLLPGLILAATLCIGATTATAQAQKPSGSVSFESGEGSTSTNILWIGCVVYFQGKGHGCSISGLQPPSGMTSPGIVRVSGIVYDLKDLSAIAGTYKSVGPDETMGPGHVRVKNEKGVVMTLWPFSTFAEIQVPDSGMKLELKQ